MYEYKIIELRTKTLTQKQFNKLGADGWKLIDVTHMQSLFSAGIIYHFMKEKSKLII